MAGAKDFILLVPGKFSFLGLPEINSVPDFARLRFGYYSYPLENINAKTKNNY